MQFLFAHDTEQFIIYITCIEQAFTSKMLIGEFNVAIFSLSEEGVNTYIESC